MLGVAFLTAFASLLPQLPVLVGSHGLLPVAPLLDALREQMGPERYRLFPTLLWIGSGDGALTFLAWAGAFFSLLLVLGLWPAPLVMVCWALYLSLATACQDFLGFQWDNLLLETAFLAMFLLGPTERLRRTRPAAPHPLALFLLRCLLFKLMFMSGLCKLASHDPTWRSLTALTFHYETQPLPTPLGWWAHQSPLGFQKVSVLVMFAIELVVPFAVFLPGRWKRAAFFPLAFLQVVIALTGNYAFFNILSLALALLVLDDDVFRRSGAAPGGAPLATRRWPRLVLIPVAAVYLLLSLVPLSGLLGLGPRTPRFLVAAYQAADPFRTVNGYGLFAVMTTERNEIVLEGSADGSTWKEYELPDKPGDVTRSPRWVAPHQPRLDWQMWFAALSGLSQNPWLVELHRKLLAGEPAVLSLFAKNPFPGRPPRVVRALLYRYRFTDVGTRRKTGAFWTRELLGAYGPELSPTGEAR
ncbi:MAG TPA: lipase maturation factor family protein [Thermoanaerobaculia bacterium]|nr:lipase maturation factor family protein [Thermoanaerobaculia bacterium]